MTAQHSLTKQRGKFARRIIRNPDDGSFTCLEKDGGAWQARYFGVDNDAAQDFLNTRQIIKS